MRVIMVSGLVMLSASAYACPNLSGQWSCTNSDNSASSFSIRQEPIANGSLYHVTPASGKSQDYYADGVTRPVTQGELSGTITATCTSDTAIAATETLNDPKHGLTAKGSTTITLKSATELESDNHLELTVGHQPPKITNTVSACHLL